MVLSRLFGTKSDREIKKLSPIIVQINQKYEDLASKTDQELIERTQELRDFVVNSRLEKENSLSTAMDRKERQQQILKAEQGALGLIMVEAFAIVKDVSRRMFGTSWRVSEQDIKWEMIPYDVQLIGAIILHNGKVAEMKTGEGKTLVATMPIYLNALTGRGVHVITVNDYLAQRDAEWMGEVYKRLGLSVGFILNSMDNSQRREMYSRDITYGTNNEFGFDYLRDNMSLQKEDKVQRGHAFAVVDEVDSVLIDEARTPLIISGAVDAPVDETFTTLKPGVQNLVKKQSELVGDLVSEAQKLLEKGDKDTAGLKLLQAQHLKEMPHRLAVFLQCKRLQCKLLQVKNVQQPPLT